MKDEMNGPREWIIQRCTQRWIGTELQYEDWPGYLRPMTRGEMLDALKRCSKEWPDDEFRGHNAGAKMPSAAVAA